MGHSSDWDEIRESIRERLPDCETCAVDLEPASNWDNSVRQLADKVPPRSVLIGYSMGARLSLALVLNHPGRYAGLVFVSGNPGIESKEARRDRWRADQELAAQIESIRDAESIAPFLQRWYQQAVFASVPEIVRQSEVRRKQANWSDRWPAILRANSISRQPNYWSQLPDIAIPVWVVAGQDDEKYRRIAVRWLENKMDSPVDTRIVPGSGHLVHRERPDALSQIIQECIDNLPTMD